MYNKDQEQHIYIVVSQPGTIVSKLLKWITGAEYNHVSISMDSDLEKMYSFGRKFTYMPFWGSFVLESPHNGTFKRFSETKVVVMEVQTDAEKYNKMKHYLEHMYRRKDQYHYNYMGLFLAGLHICYKKRNHYYCSEFVRDLLLRFQIADKRQFESITQPIHFLDLPMCNVTYRGKLRCYE